MDFKQVTLSCGNGGKESLELIEGVFKPYLQEFLVADGEDGGVFRGSGDLAMSTDSFVVDPLFFAGGDIGKLSVCGSANDVAVMGARPEYLGMGFMLEEGLPIATLERILESVRAQLRLGKLKLLSLDTKVLPKSSMDKIFINTTALGRVLYPALSAKNLQEGQSLILSAPIGAHGALLFSLRHEIGLHSALQSDCQQLFGLLEPVFSSGYPLYALRDATRGGLAALLHEWARASLVAIEIEETQIPILEEVRGVCEILGLEPYVLANEGVCVLCVNTPDAPKICDLLQAHGGAPAIIGKVLGKTQKPCVYLKNAWGSRRYLEMPEGELLPRIC
ncbi:[NiFe] hydrogenase metallocenter assembly protein HypE [Helicobacter bizzozeronii CIII-1]|uniref:[NiFe] hydrogenase metallocenter assembly protein HypE n=1 Tax=Helicobacter bizzozeronii (strain CIII-1) TaxID=1002804 RepID=F8KQ87_HELBC|nr:hydrogenase expression/formation protein HypE [Helicobacter bizzozeronii]CCB80115.1 [NiFe] hydrogenase metallocenter assembly protein HypE [Helicobacter bizzozeronii CIII-1]